MIAVPRLSKLGEHYDDHQAEITDAFVKRGLVLAANSPAELRQALDTARHRTPVLATTDPKEMTAFLEGLIAGLKPRRHLPS